MANNNIDDIPIPEDIDAFFEENSHYFENLDNTLMTDTDTESINPGNIALNTDFGDFNGFSAPQEMVPVVPEQQQQMPAPTVGACYHPEVGWYYPTTKPANVPPPPPPMFPMGMTPVTSAPTSGMSTPVPAAADFNTTSAPQRARAQGKRKYGPSAYLDARAEGRTSIPNEEANYFASSASRREGRGDVPTGNSSAFDQAFARKETRPSIQQACICEDHEAERIKRPKNAFILFRLAKADEIRKSLGTTQNQDVSTQAGQMWKAAPPHVKAHFKGLAEAEKRRHEEKYPDYKYKPGGHSRSKFGTRKCTCGAYELNMAHFQQKRSGKAPTGGVSNFDFNINDAAADSDVDSAYIPARTITRPQAPAPTAVMQQPPPDLDIASLGLPAHQQAQAEAIMAGLKRKHNNLTIATGNDEEPPRKQRRSSRAAAANVNYTEPDEENLFDLGAEDLFDFGASCKTPSSTAVDHYNPHVSPRSLRSNSRKGSKAPTTPSQSPLFVTPSPPAKNTRSQSRGDIREGSSSPLKKFDDSPIPAPKFTRGQTPIKIEDSDDEDDDVVVAPRTRSARNASKTSEVSARSTRSQTTRRRSLRSGGL